MFTQATPPMPLQSLRNLDIVDVESNWLPLLGGATNLVELSVQSSPDALSGILSAVDSLPSLQRVCRAGGTDQLSLFLLGQIEAALKRRGGEIKFIAMPARSSDTFHILRQCLCELHTQEQRYS